MKNLFFSCILLISFPLFSYSQSVGINNDASNPHASAMLDVKSTTKGMLIPRMNTSQRTMISTPATGLLVFDTDFTSFWFYNGSAWINLSATTGGNSIVDTDSDTSVDVEQTADDDLIRFKTNGFEIGKLDDKTFHLGQTDGSLLIGKDAGLNDDGTNNVITAVGFEALYNNSVGSNKVTHGVDNTAMGYKALRNNTIGYDNTAFGSNALSANSEGFQNVAIGSQSLESNTYGDDNVAIGFLSMQSNTNGDKNVAVGYGSLEDNYSGDYNTSLGNLSMNKNLGGNSNVAIGRQSLFNLTDGDYNNSIGPFALFNNLIGNSNTAIGRYASYKTTSSKNISIGDYSMYENTTGYSNIAIGDNALRQNTLKSNLVAIGDSSLYHNGSINTGAGYAQNNTAVGSKAMYNNTDGSYGTALGYEALKNNTLGSYNTAIGNEALFQNTIGEYNVSVGASSLRANIEGTSNIAMGVSALIDNTNGNRNLGIGNSSLNKNTTGSDNVAIGYAALNQNTVISNTVAIGDSTLAQNGLGASGDDATLNTGVGSKALAKNEVGKQNTALGSQALYENDYGNYNTAIGSEVLKKNVSGGTNTGVGASALFNSNNGDGNIAVGYASLYNNDSGDNNTALGSYTLFKNTSGNRNVALGKDANYYNQTGSNNTIIGYEAGQSTSNHSKSGNVFLGYQAGYSEIGDNKLYIENSNSSSPLIYGEFDNNKLQINGELNINGNYTFPTTDGSTDQILTTNGSGDITWEDYVDLEKWQPIAPASPDIHYSSGLVGIGTIIPSSLLHVNGFVDAGTFSVNGILGGDKTGINVTVQNHVTNPDSLIGVRTKALGSQGVNISLLSETSSSDDWAGILDGKVRFANSHLSHNQIMIAPKATTSQDSTSLFFAEDTDGTFGMYWLYDGTDNEMQLFGKANSTTYGPHFTVSRNDGVISIGDDGIIFNPDVAGDSRITTDELEIRGGSDLAENFDITDIDMLPSPGMIVSIDPDNPGKLQITTDPYCPRIAGIISGANGIDPGMRMGQKGTIADGEYPITLTGRVYVKSNDIGGDIIPGDLLTSSIISGEAMKANRSQLEVGMSIGKALSFPDENDYVLVLVSL